MNILRDSQKVVTELTDLIVLRTIPNVDVYEIWNATQCVGVDLTSLIYECQTYPGMVPDVKGTHLTIDSLDHGDGGWETYMAVQPLK
jgi:hypothetical protein